MIRKGLICFVCIWMAAVSFAADAGEKSHWDNMGRGAVNLLTCAAEMPRCMVYRNSQVPLWGFVSGAVEGVGCTVMRAFTGVTDLLFLGYGENPVFSPVFCEYVWDSAWLPSSGRAMADADCREKK